MVTELDYSAGLGADGQAHCDDATMVENGGSELVAELGWNAVLHAHAFNLKVLGQQFHCNAHIVSIVHVPVVVDVGSHYPHRIKSDAAS